MTPNIRPKTRPSIIPSIIPIAIASRRDRSIPRIFLCAAVVTAVAVLVEPAMGQQPAITAAVATVTTASAARPTSAVATPAAAAAATDSAIAFTGEVRTRGEYDRPGSGVGGDGATMLRTRFGARARLGAGVRMFAQLQDSRIFGQRGGTMSGSADQLDLRQGYLELGGKWRARDLALRAGRQEIAFGNERLVGAADWTSTGRSFDGARVDLSPAGSAWRATAFAATLAEHGRLSPAATAGDAPRSDETLAGVALVRGNLEALVAHDRGVHYRVYDDVRRTTAYARYRHPAASGVALDLEGAYQVGRQDHLADAASGVPRLAQDVGAWFAGARLTRAATDAFPAALAVGIDWLSGDDDPDDGSYGAFNTLYATNHKWYGSMDLFLDPAARTGDRGLVDVMAGTAVKLSSRATLRADVHHFRTAADGAVATTGGAPVDRTLGWEADLTLPLRLAPAAGVELGYAIFRPGAGGESLGLGRDGSSRQWGYLQLRVGF
ncbi:MAG: alginate export family protein [Gemmatimonadaceae bacterium]